MVINLFVRRAKDNPSRVTLKASLSREEGDTPRIANLALDIKSQLDEMIDRCIKSGEIHISAV